jgi:hypothetical protein
MSRPKLKGELWSVALRILLVSVNVFVFLLCLAVFVTGVWGRVVEKNYLDVTGEPTITRTSLSVAVVGACASLLTLMGILGSVLYQSIWGRMVLSVYAFVLPFVIVAEVAAGVAAIQYRNSLESRTTIDTVKSLNSTYAEGNETSWNHWDQFQTDMECCGARNYTDYYDWFGQNIVPRSCCTNSARRNGQCPNYSNALNLADIHSKPCLDVIVPHLKTVMLEIAIVAIAIGAAQIVGIVASAIAILWTAFLEERKTRSYKRLDQRTSESSDYSAT